MTALPDFDCRQLARAVENLTCEDIDEFPYGVIRLDAQDTVVLFNEAEARLSGYETRPARGRRGGALDIAFSFSGDFCDSGRELHVRVQSSQNGGCWILNRRSP